MVQITW